MGRSASRNHPLGTLRRFEFGAARRSANLSTGSANTLAPPETGPWFISNLASACRYASSCRRMALRSSAVHHNLTQRAFFHRSRHGEVLRTGNELQDARAFHLVT